MTGATPTSVLPLLQPSPSQREDAPALQTRRFIHPPHGANHLPHGTHGPRLTSGRLMVAVARDLPPAERASRVRRQLVAWYRRHAEERIPERVEIWRQRTGLEPAGVLIRSQASRWGSCDAKGVLRFNWRIVQAPGGPSPLGRPAGLVRPDASLSIPLSSDRLPGERLNDPSEES